MGIRLSNAASGGVMALVATKSFSGNAVEFAGLAGNYRYELHLSMTVVDASYANLEINGDTNVLHYYGQSFTCNDAAVSGTRFNNSYVALMDVGTPAGGYYCVSTIRRVADGYVHHQSFLSGPADTEIVFRNVFGAKTDATVTEITSIKIVKSGGTSITGVASLYKISV